MPYNVIYANTTLDLPRCRISTSAFDVTITFPTSEEALLFKGDPATKTRTMKIEDGSCVDPQVHELNMLLIQHGYTPCDSTFQTWATVEGTVFFRAAKDAKYLSVGVEIDFESLIFDTYQANFVFNSDEDAKAVTGKAEAIHVMKYTKPDTRAAILPGEIIHIKKALLENGYEIIGNHRINTFGDLGRRTGTYYLRAPAPEPKKRSFMQMMGAA